MDKAIVDLAKLFKERDNAKVYSCMFGEIVSLSPLNILIDDSISINEVRCTFDLYEQDEDDRYINQGKTIVLLPYANMQKFIGIGVLRDGRYQP